MRMFLFYHIYFTLVIIYHIIIPLFRLHYDDLYLVPDGIQVTNQDVYPNSLLYIIT